MRSSPVIGTVVCGIAAAIAVVATIEAAERTPHGSERERVMRVLDKAIELRRNLQASRSGQEHDYEKGQEALQAFDDKELVPALNDCVELLSVGRDIDLLVKVLRTSIAYESSAEESFSFTIGEIFVKNASTLEEAWAHFSQPERKVLRRQLRAGWIAATYDLDASDPRLTELRQRLRRLGVEVSEATPSGTRAD